MSDLKKGENSQTAGSIYARHGDRPPLKTEHKLHISVAHLMGAGQKTMGKVHHVERVYMMVICQGEMSIYD